MAGSDNLHNDPLEATVVAGKNPARLDSLSPGETLLTKWAQMKEPVSHPTSQQANHFVLAMQLLLGYLHSHKQRLDFLCTPCLPSCWPKVMVFSARLQVLACVLAAKWHSHALDASYAQPISLVKAYTTASWSFKLRCSMENLSADRLAHPSRSHPEVVHGQSDEDELNSGLGTSDLSSIGVIAFGP